METLIKFRPHHFMCSIGFRGSGYSVDFIKNYQEIMDRLNSSDDTQIEVVHNGDDVCNACPHLLDNNLCIYQDKVSSLDIMHSKILNLKHGQIITWRNAKMLIKNNMTPENLEVACKGCSWLSSGICLKALQAM